MLEAALHFYILNGKKYNNQFGKKRTKPRKCKPKKRRHFIEHMHAESIGYQSIISTNLCFWQTLSDHSKGSLLMNVDGVRAKKLGLKYQCLTFFCLCEGLGTSDDGLPVFCALFSYGSFLNVIFCWPDFVCPVFVELIWIQCMCLSETLLHAEVNVLCFVGLFSFIHIGDVVALSN